MRGKVNTPGVLKPELDAAIDDFRSELIADIISGEVSAPLAASDGTELLESGGGETILAYRKLDVSDVINASVSAVLESAIAAHNANENSHDGYLAVSQ